MTMQEIDTRIHELETALGNPGTFPTEVYTRIVGYYRSLANWNAGKREEYDHRRTFDEDDVRINEALRKAEMRFPESVGPTEPEKSREQPRTRAASYRIYWRALCPNCPAMKAKLPELKLKGVSYDVDSAEGFRAAAADEVTSTPTLILLDDQSRELTRIVTATEWTSLTPYLIKA